LHFHPSFVICIIDNEGHVCSVVNHVVAILSLHGDVHLCGAGVWCDRNW
jgi:hypothetical protein